MTSQRLGEYEIVREIGKGGMGMVYLARNVYLPGMEVVLKILLDPEQKERFLREALVLSQLDHKYICQIRSFFEHEGDLVIAMQYVEGKNLADWMSDWQEVNLRLVQKIFLQVLEGLDYSHAKGVYHRDLKPSNIMVDEQGQVKIIDFGIARQTQNLRLTKTTQAIGTPQYMAPEQFTESNIAQPWLCDIYSLGISLFEACCGHPPYEATTPYKLMEMHKEQKPQRPSSVNKGIAPKLEKVILKAIAKKPEDRYQCALEMRDALASIPCQDLGSSMPIKVLSDIKPPANRQPFYIAALFLLIVVLGVSLFLILGKDSPKTEQIIFEVPSQQVSASGSFVPIPLSSYLPAQLASDVARWEASGMKELRVSISSEANATIEKPSSNWTGIDTIWFVAIRAEGQRDSAMAEFSSNMGNSRPIISEIPQQVITSGRIFRPIILDDVVSDPDDPDSVLSWSSRNSEHIAIKIKNRIASVFAAPGWIGRESFAIKVQDRAGATSEREVSFEVVAAPDSLFPAIVKVVPTSCNLLQNGKIVGNPYSASLRDGVHRFTAEGDRYPIHDINLFIDSRILDTIINLEEIYKSSPTGEIAIFVVTNADKDIRKEISINGFPSGFISGESPRRLPQGEYRISLNWAGGPAIDSVAQRLDNVRKRLNSNEPVVFIPAEHRVFVYFYITPK